MLFVKIKLVGEGKIPTYAHESDACCDCYARLDNDLVIEPYTIAKIPLGFCLELNQETRAMIYPRSGLSSKGYVAITGVIDSNYRGEVCCSMFNTTDVPFVVSPNDRICQMAIEPYYKADFFITDDLNGSERNEDGFGSTGV